MGYAAGRIGGVGLSDGGFVRIGSQTGGRGDRLRPIRLGGVRLCEDWLTQSACCHPDPPRSTSAAPAPGIPARRAHRIHPPATQSAVRHARPLTKSQIFRYVKRCVSCDTAAIFVDFAFHRCVSRLSFIRHVEENQRFRGFPVRASLSAFTLSGDTRSVQQRGDCAEPT